MGKEEEEISTEKAIRAEHWCCLAATGLLIRFIFGDARKKYPTLKFPWWSLECFCCCFCCEHAGGVGGRKEMKEKPMIDCFFGLEERRRRRGSKWASPQTTQTKALCCKMAFFPSPGKECGKWKEEEFKRRHVCVGGARGKRRKIKSNSPPIPHTMPPPLFEKLLTKDPSHLPLKPFRSEQDLPNSGQKKGVHTTKAELVNTVGESLPFSPSLSCPTIYCPPFCPHFIALFLFPILSLPYGVSPLDRRNGTAAEAAFRYQKNKIPSHVAFSLSLLFPSPFPCRSERSRGREKEEEETEVLDPMVGRRRGEGRGAKRMEKP